MPYTTLPSEQCVNVCGVNSEGLRLPLKGINGCDDGTPEREYMNINAA